MSNRRQFLQSSLALSVLASPAIASSAFAADVHGDRALFGPTIERFVFDLRFPEAVELARQAAARGVRVAETDGDLTDLWYDDLDLRWKQAPMTLAGVTTWHGLFVLETLAADRRMRVTHRQVLVPAAGEVELYRWIIAPRATSPGHNG